MKEEMMFIGRKEELTTLDKLCRNDRFEFAVLYGRKRMGKSTLLGRIMEFNRTVCFNALEMGRKQNLEYLSEAVWLGLSSDGRSGGVFPSFEAAFEYVFEFSLNEKTVFIIDEYQYLAKCDKSINLLLLTLIDKYRGNSKLTLILSGSSIPYMENEVMSDTAPLSGYITARIKLEPLGFREISQFFPGKEWREKALLYGVFGGTPFYLECLDPSKDVDAIIQETCFNMYSLLFEEPVNQLRQEVKEVAQYNAILGAMARGASRMSEIARDVDSTSSNCAKLMNRLIELGIVKKECPYGETRIGNKKTLYSIEDKFFRFWYRFVPASIPDIQRQDSNRAYNRIKSYLNYFTSPVFSEICEEYLWLLQKQGKLPVSFSSLGRWWGNNPFIKEQVEIDIMGEADKETALYATCKWSGKKVNSQDLEKLIHNSHLFHYLNNYYFVFSESGFTRDCLKKAERIPNVYLVTFEEMAKEFGEDLIDQERS